MKQVFIMALLAAGMLLTGCAKDSENNGMEETGRYLTSDEIRELLMPLLVGTWVHDGDAYGDDINEGDGIKSIGVDGMTATDSDYTFVGSERDTLTFSPDGHVKLMRDESDELAVTFGFESDGWIPGFGYSWGCLTPYYMSPFRFNIVYPSEGGKSGHYAQRDSFIAVLFDASRTTMYLFYNQHPSHRWYLYRYRKQ